MTHIQEIKEKICANATSLNILTNLMTSISHKVDDQSTTLAEINIKTKILMKNLDKHEKEICKLKGVFDNKKDKKLFTNQVLLLMIGGSVSVIIALIGLLKF